MTTKKRLLSAILGGVLIVVIASMFLIKVNKENYVLRKSSDKNRTVLAFTTYYYPEDKSSYNQMVQNTSFINNIATDTYTIDTKGNLSGNVPKKQIIYANSNKIRPLAMVTNKFNGDLAKVLLEDSANRKLLIQNILNTLKTNDYKGVNMDFEGIYYYDRDYYASFLKELYGELSPQGFTVTVSVPAKSSENLKDSWSGAYDYKEISKYADQVVLMTYDEHSPSGPSGSIASINWVKAVVKYAASIMPNSKIILGVASYGYDWSSSGVKAYGIDAIYKLAESYNAEIQWNDSSKSPFFKYKDKSGVSHTVWFENSTSLSYKLDIVNDNNLAGIAIWRLGLENEDYWSTIKAKLSKAS